MADIKSKYDASWTDITPAGLNSLATESSVSTSEFDNATNKALDYEFIFAYQYGTDPTANNDITITVECTDDGTNWTDKNNYTYKIILTADTTQHRVPFSLKEMVSRDFPPSRFRVKITNNGGEALGASGNYLKYRKVFGEVV